MQVLIKSGTFRRFAMLLVVSMTLLGMVPPVDAAFITSQDSFPSVTGQSEATAVQRDLERKVVVEKLAALGLTDQEVMDRLDQLTDRDMHQLATQVQGVTAASGGGALIITVLVIVILVLAILKLSDRTIVIGG